VCSLERANLHAGLAGHLAKSGEKEQALRHIREAEALASRGGDIPEWAGFLTQDHLNSIITQALAAIGEQAEAIRRFEDLLPRIGTDRLRGRAGRMIDLAEVYAATGELERASSLAQQASEALTDVRSTRMTARLALLNETVARAAS
jgi:tetratricopeptide (TPR) repeat protein